MHKVFIATHYEGGFKLPVKVIKALPKRLVLAMPVQFLGFSSGIIEQLTAAGKKVQLFHSKHGRYPGQVLGCDVFSFAGEYDAFLYVGDGKFHPTALLYDNCKPVYCFNPFTSKMEVLAPETMKKVAQLRQGMLSKLLSSSRVGILVTTKPGQNHMSAVEELRGRLEKAGKEVYIFLADEINFSSLENFNFIQMWINSGCPRIVEDFKCLNLLDLQESGFI